MVGSENEVRRRADIVAVAFKQYLDAVVTEALVKPGVSLSIQRAKVDEDWVRERVRSAQPDLADATRGALETYVDRHLAYLRRYDEDPHPHLFSGFPIDRPPAQNQDRQLVGQRLDVWVRSLATAVEEEIAEAVGDWLRDRPGNLALELAAADTWRIQSSTKGIADTTDARRFRDVCTDNPTGAIGLAGPRGCGKTTLLTHGPGHETPAPGAPLRGKVRVVVSAPVKYESRDFLLHLFAEICRSVVRQRHPSYWYNFPFRRRRFPTRAVTRSAATAVMAYLVALIVTEAWLHGWEEPFRQALAYARVVWAWMQLPRGEGTLPYAEPDALTTVLLVVSFIAVYLAARRAMIWTVVTRRDKDLPPLVRSASRHLEAIRTLHTAATAGVSSELGVAGVKVAANRSVEHSVRAWSFPELISEMKEFLSEVTGTAIDHAGHNTLSDYDPFGVIVVIDELDKIDSVDDVQRFINEVKGIFDAPGTQVLVSISEDALAAFELRGLPVRDTFDSAFASVVRIGYLSIADTRRILERLDLPALSRPFVWLVYCLSGGLPRDVIRVGGELYAMARTQPGESLGTVCRDLVGRDIQRRLPAFEQACGDLLRAAEPGSEQRILELVRVIRRVVAVRGQHQAANLIAAVPDLLAAQGVGDLGKQTGSYLYYCATVLDILVIDELGAADEERYKRLLPVLVEGRQAMAVHPDLAVELIEEFRRTWGLPLLVNDVSV